MKAKNEHERLEPLQNAFCVEYCKDRRPRQAAIRAGYKEKAAAAQASRLLKLPYIQYRISQLDAANRRLFRANREEALAELAKIAYLDIKTQFQNINESGVTLKAFEELDGTVLASVNEKRDKEGASFVEVKFHDKMKALELILKHTGGVEPTEDPNTPAPTYNINFIEAKK